MAELIDQLLTDGPTEEELRRAKAQFERHWLHELARIDSRADALGEYATLHGDPHLINPGSPRSPPLVPRRFAMLCGNGCVPTSERR